MQILKNYIEQIRTLISGMSAAAKLAVGLLLVVILGMVALLIVYGGRAEMVAVFNAPLSGEDLGRAEHVLRRENIEVEVDNGLLKVPADKRDAAWAALAYEAILPADSVSEFERLAREPSMWRTESQDRRLWHQAKQSKLSQLIGMFPGVTKAKAIVEAGQPKRLGTPAVSATASVHVTLKRGETMSTKLRAAIADLVSGSVSGMARSDVRIVDATNGRSYRVKEQEDLGGDALEMVVGLESHYRENVKHLFPDIPNLFVSVYVVRDTLKRKRSVVTEHKDPVTGMTKSSTTETEGPSGSGAEPGVSTSTNSVVRLPTAAEKGSSSTTNDEDMTLRFPGLWSESEEGPRFIGRISASVAVPLDSLVARFKHRDDTGAEPDDIQLNTEMTRIRDLVMPALGLVPGKEEDLVKVAWYIPGPPAEPTEPVTAGVLTTVANYGKPAALGALAMAALLMVLMFARRRSQVPTSATSSIFSGGPDGSVGMVDGIDVALEGVELNDDQVRAQRVVQQVSQMVKEKPDGAASLIRRWVEED